MLFIEVRISTKIRCGRQKRRHGILKSYVVAFSVKLSLTNGVLILDAVGLAVHIIVTAQAAVESGCAGRDFLA